LRISDLYNLTEEVLLPLERFAEKSARNAIAGIAASAQIPFERVLFGLGIRYVGETVAKKLARHFNNIQNLMAATFEDLIAVDEIGDRIAGSVLEFFANPENIQLIRDLQAAGLQFEIPEKLREEGAHLPLEGKTLVVSGKFDGYGRDEIKALIETLGGKVSGSISGKTDFVVAGADMGPSKRQKAEALGVKILEEAEFNKYIEKN
jgi:DNA ligase (NAD+)